MLQMKKVALALVLGSALAAHAEDIKVGIALDISGPFSALGAEARAEDQHRNHPARGKPHAGIRDHRGEHP